VHSGWGATSAAEGNARLPCCFDALGSTTSCRRCSVQRHSEAILRFLRGPRRVTSYLQVAQAGKLSHPGRLPG
jgi:hypothetical protein